MINGNLRSACHNKNDDSILEEFYYTFLDTKQVVDLLVYVRNTLGYIPCTAWMIDVSYCSDITKVHSALSNTPDVLLGFTKVGNETFTTFSYSKPINLLRRSCIFFLQHIIDHFLHHPLLNLPKFSDQIVLHSFEQYCQEDNLRSRQYDQPEWSKRLTEFISRHRNELNSLQRELLESFLFLPGRANFFHILSFFEKLEADKTLLSSLNSNGQKLSFSKFEINQIISKFIYSSPLNQIQLK